MKSSKSVVSSKSKASTRYQVENQVDQGEESGWSETEDEKESEKESGGGKRHFWAKFENCKSKRFRGTPAQAGKMDSIILQCWSQKKAIQVAKATNDEVKGEEHFP